MGLTNMPKTSMLSNAMTRLGSAFILNSPRLGPSTICSGRPFGLFALSRSKGTVHGICSGRPNVARYAFSEALGNPFELNRNKSVLVPGIQSGRSINMPSDIMNRYDFSTSLFLFSWVSRTFASIRDSILNMIGWPKQ